MILSALLLKGEATATMQLIRMLNTFSRDNNTRGEKKGLYISEGKAGWKTRNQLVKM